MNPLSLEDTPLINNQSGSKKRFELHIGDHIAYVDYILNKKGVIYLTHTEVPESLEGKGVGSAIISKALGYIREKNLKMAPLCPFVAAYLKEHPNAAQGLLASGFSIG